MRPTCIQLPFNAFTQRHQRHQQSNKKEVNSLPTGAKRKERKSGRLFMCKVANQIRQIDFALNRIERANPECSSAFQL